MAALGLFLLAVLLVWAGIYHALPLVARFFASSSAAVLRALGRRTWFRDWYERDRTRVLRSYWPLVVALTVGFVVAAVLGAGFIELAEGVQGGNVRLQRVDQGVWQAAPWFRSEGTTAFFVAVSALGTGIALGVLALLAAVMLARGGRRSAAAYVVVTTLGSQALNMGLKAYFARVRPDLTNALGWSQSYAFPSGHAMTSLAVLGGLSYVIASGAGSWRARSGCVSLALSLAGAIGVSRVYLGVHWLSDVVAGFAAGMVWLAVTTGIFDVVRRLRVPGSTSKGERSERRMT